MSENFTRKQLDAIEMLKKWYPRGVSVEDPDARAVFDGLIARGSGLVRCVDRDDTPTGDAYCLTDDAAEAFREDAQERAIEARMN
jgi:hypothetical protein